MPLTPPNKLSRERILAYGSEGTGKSFNYYAIARLAAKTDSDAKFYIIDTDVSVGRMVSDPDLAVLFDDAGDLRNIEYTDVHDWESLKEAVDKYSKIMRPQDWLMVDMTTVTWQWVQDWYTRTLYGKGQNEYFVARRAAEIAAGKEGKVFEGNNDWVKINSEYGVFKTSLLRCPGNLYCTAESKPLDLKNADKQTKLRFQSLGMVPAGQKGMPFLFHTNLLMNCYKAGEFVMTSPKERSRPDLIEQTVGDFGVSFLVAHAGWKLA